MSAAGHTHHHDHTHGMAKQMLAVAFFLTIIILAAEVIGGLLANSLALIADAGHVLTDLFALGLAWFAAVQAERPADDRKTFGYHRVGILAALINALTLILVTAWILWEAMGRFQHPQPVQPLVMFPSAGIGIVVNLVIGFGLRREGDNLNVRAAALHVFGDVGASVAVIVAGGIIWKTRWYPADPILSVGIALLIAWGAWRILRESMTILLEAVPEQINLSALVRDIMRVKGVYDVHDLHVWSITGGMPALSCHACIDDLSLGQSITMLQELETMLQKHYRIRHTTIQFEYHAHHKTYCAVDSLHCQITPLEASHEHEHGHGQKHKHNEHQHEHKHEHEHCQHEEHQEVLSREPSH